MDKKQIEEFSLKLAIWDMIPVLVFAGSVACIAGVFDSILFRIGAVVCILSGVCKVAWKFILAIKKRNVFVLSKQMRFLMPIGFLLMILAAVLDRQKINWATVWRFLSVPYVYGVFVLALLGFVAMFVLSLVLDQKKAGNNRIEQTVNTITQVILFLAVGQICYFGNYYKAVDVEKYFQITEELVVEKTDTGWLFDGPGEKEAMIFYPGAKVEATAYAPILYQLAKEEGIDCFLVEMPCNFALYGLNKASDIMNQYAYEKWYLAGHSLGGASACMYASKHEDKVDGLFLFGAYLSKDIKEVDYPVLVFYGSEDGVINRGNLEKGRKWMPKNSAEVVIEGGNHALFGSYGEQKGDEKALITHEEQWDQTVTEIVKILEKDRPILSEKQENEMSETQENVEIIETDTPEESTGENESEEITESDMTEEKENGEKTEIIWEEDLDYPGMRNITTMALVREMGLGINLGNTFESCGDWIAQWGDGSVKSYETAWGSPMITREMIQGYADAGYGVLRIPVAWSNLADSEYNLSPAYMDAVQEVVDWTLDTGMYAIINIHHDNGWMAGFPKNPEGCMKRYEKIWTQVAERFKDYGDHLMFESLNEEASWGDVWNQWSGSIEEKKIVFELCNDINQKFVDVVRGSGGNNPKRHLLIASYNTDIDMACDRLFVMPNDPAGRRAVSIHYYTPSNFAILSEDADWGKSQYTWGTSSDIATVERYMKKLDTTFISQGIPVIMGEYGCTLQNKDMNSVYKYLTIVPKKAYDHQICPILWDTTDQVYDRTSCKVKYPELLKAYDAIRNGEEIPEVEHFGE